MTTVVEVQDVIREAKAAADAVRRAVEELEQVLDRAAALQTDDIRTLQGGDDA